MKPLLETFEDLPGQTRIVARSSPAFAVLAAVVGAAWPPLIFTLPIWPASSWAIGRELDWRLVVMIVGLIGISFGLWRINCERKQFNRPSTRLGVVWRFVLYGGVLAGALQIGAAIILMVLGWFEAGDFIQGVGMSETTLLIFGVALLPVAMVVGISYALWAGLCAAFIAFEAKPVVRNRMGVISPSSPEA